MTTTAQLTAADLWDLVTTRPLPEGITGYELIEGELHDVCPAGGIHGEIASEFHLAIGGYVKSHDLGKVYTAETGFFAVREPDAVLAPDVAFVARPHLPAFERRRKYMPVAPDLAVEIVSPSERPALVWQKVGKYHEGGTRRVWVAWPESREVTVMRDATPPRTLGADDWLDGEDVLPGFRERVGGFFPEA